MTFWISDPRRGLDAPARCPQIVRAAAQVQSQAEPWVARRPLTSCETQVLGPQRCQQTAQAAALLIGPASEVAMESRTVRESPIGLTSPIGLASRIERVWAIAQLPIAQLPIVR